MPDRSASLSLPFLQPSQAQKHVTHNEALILLDALTQLAVADRDLTTPPSDPGEGDRYIVASGATGAWAGEDGNVAVHDGTAWLFCTPQTGWRAWVEDEERLVTWRGGAWRDDSGLPLGATTLGVNASADAVNRLAVSAQAVLLTHAGSDHQVKVNKAGSGDTASLLYQSNWSGRAEMGLAGDDDFSIKVSADGSAWVTALRFDGTDGSASGDAVQSDAGDDTIGRLMTVGAFGLGGGAVAAPSDDADNCTLGGLWDFTASGANCPLADPSGGTLLALPGGSGTRQVFANEEGTRLWLRSHDGASWSNWSELFTQASVVGTVSETAGVPSGAVIESGANGNGEYIRWADGTQICTNGGAAISTDPAAFTGTAVSIDGGKLKIGRWF
ncbi:Protein of unknown function [Pseudooceanicola antarcticus]|uniref:DUF2793 domain-containing protein n=1 Tax=Pseudooceanicola antarcticus TaxID=1247613 RepID=A0A285IH45_9RHOB|nr:DUF2793 domain-containing protein [Pseudooceanicola antarcticus]SNY47305.1 Protein of unknown function [Pseudooceanicola antarcticus]